MRWYWWVTIFGGFGLIYLISKSKSSYNSISKTEQYTPTTKEPDFESGKDVLLNIKQPDESRIIRA